VPSLATIIATADNCPADPNTKSWLTKDSLTISGSDVVLTYVQNDECSVTGSAVVAAKPINREVILTEPSQLGPSDPGIRFVFNKGTTEVSTTF